MTAPNDLLDRYRTRGWQLVPVHRPHPDTGRCSCGRDPCPNPGKHPDARYWPGGTADMTHFAGRNVGVQLGPVSANLADVDKDCREAVAAGTYLLPSTPCTFGRGGLATHDVYVVSDGAASFAKLLDPVLPGSQATIVELRWPERNADGALKAVQTVFPPSLHSSGDRLEWFHDGDPAPVSGADLAAAVRHVGAAVLVARYARPKERHALVLLLANLLVRAGWADDARVVAFVAAVFAARNDPDKLAKVLDGEGRGAVQDARKRLRERKPMTGLPALREMLDPALPERDTDAVVARVREWLNVPDTGRTQPIAGGGSSGGPRSAPPRYTPLPPWRPFPVDHLPTALRDFTRTVADAMRCDPTYAALPALAACAGMIGTTRAIRLKRSWAEPAMTWAVVVGDSGTLKTPPYKRAIAPVIALQGAAIKAHRQAMERYRADLREYERAKRRAKDDDPGDPPVEPACERFYARDTTVEALAGLMTHNRTRFLVGRDELNGWLTSFNQYKAKGGSDQSNWLELHSRGTLVVDRKTGDPKTIFVDGVGVSLCGGIQPGVLRAALTPQHFSAGIPARLLFAYPPRRPKEWTEDDIDEGIEQAYHRLVQDLAGLRPHTDADGDPYPVTLGLTPEGKAEWVAFFGRFADRQAEAEGDLAAAFSKLEGYAARLALVHHVCQSVHAGEEALEAVTADSVRAGIALAEWFTYEAERVYQMLGEETVETETRKLVELVERLAERHGGTVSVRSLQRAHQKKYRSPELAEAALESLVALGLGRWEPVESTGRGGRPLRVYRPGVTGDTGDTTDDEGGPWAGDGGDDGPSPPDGSDPVPFGTSRSSDEPSGNPDRTPREVVSPVSPVTLTPETRNTPTDVRSQERGCVTPARETRATPESRCPATGGPPRVTGDTGDTTLRSGGATRPTEGDTRQDRGPSPVRADGGQFDAMPVSGVRFDDSGRALREVVSPVSPVTLATEGPSESPRGPRPDEPGVTRDPGTRSTGQPAHPPRFGSRGHGLGVTGDTGDTTALRTVAADRIGDVVAAVEDSGGPVGVDTETTGLDPRIDRVRLLQVATDRGTFLVDLFALSDPRAALAPLFEVLGAVEVVGHNLQFDLRFLAPLGFVPGKVFDTLLASRVLHAGERDGNARIAHGLGDVAARELGRTLDKAHQQADWSRALTPDMLAYAAADAAVLLPLAESLRAKLAQADLTATAALEMRALPGIAWARPVAVDAAAWTALARSAREEVRRLDEEMAVLAPNPNRLFGGWNWNSPEQAKAAFASVGVDLTSTGDDVLAGIDHPLARRLRDYRGATKRAGAYGQEWLKRHVGADGRVLPSWNQLGAESGRMSCSDPNLQQVPRGSDYRRCFVAGPGNVLVKADYSQVELRIAARVADEGVMIQAYRDGRDLHRLTASRVLGKPEGDLSKDDRQVAKSLNFGLLYGMGWRGLKGYARANYGVALTDARARGYRDAFFRTYPGLRAWHRREGDKLDRLFRSNPDGTHEVRTLAGRRRVLSVSKRRADGTPYPNVTDALNTPVQGTGADGLKLAIARLWESRVTCPTAVPVIFCHDEIVLEVPEADAQTAADWLKRCMVEAVAPLIAPVPVEVEVSVGATWGG